MYIKFGRRPTMLFSQLMVPRANFCITSRKLTFARQYTFGTLGCAQATTFSGFMAARVIHALGSGVCEALPVQCVNDVYFLHERGKRISYYIAALCIGSIGPLPAGYMLAAGYSFRLFFYVELAFALALLLVTFFLVPETAYKRKIIPTAGSAPYASNVVERAGSGLSATAEPVAQDRLEVGGAAITTQRLSYWASLKPWSCVDHEAEFWMMMVRSFSYFVVPHVLWVTTSFGKSHIVIHHSQHI